MVEVFELRGKVREVLQAVTERVGNWQEKELLLNKVNFLRIVGELGDGYEEEDEKSGVKLKKKSIGTMMMLFRKSEKRKKTG